MAPIPVVCDNCGRLWVSDGLIGVSGGGTVRAELVGTTVSPCPYCSGTGHVPDGVYELSENAATYLGGLGTIELRALLQLMTRARDENLSAVEVADRIETEVPAAAKLGGLLRDSGTPLATWLALLVVLVQLLLPLAEHQDKPITEEQTKLAFVQALEEVQKGQRESPKHSTVRHAHPRVGRNERCPCGSGKKFKQCHGR